MKENTEYDVNLLIANCESEAVERPGFIQPHGYLLVVDRAEFSIKYISNNWDEISAFSLNQLLGKHVSELLGDSFYQQLQELLKELGHKPLRPVEFTQWKHEGRSFQVLLHIKNDLLFLELEQHASLENQLSNRWLNRYQDAASTLTLQEILDDSVHEIRRISGYDRVMIYRFHPDMHGEIVAENKREDLEPFLGLHYPSTDIPKQARELYLTNWTRILVDIDYVPVPLLTHEPSAQALDMSHCVLRSVSPVHVRYLQNMGVGATLTISLIYRERLWGLVACHHYQPKFIDFHVREACETIGRMLSLYLPDKDKEEIRKANRARRDLIQRIALQVDEKKDFLKGLASNDEILNVLENAEGVAVIYYDQSHCLGTNPSEKHLQEFIRWFEENKTENYYFSSNLEEDYPHYENFSQDIKGLMLLKVYEQSPIYLCWFRRELIHHITWAGDPEKLVVEEDGVMKLTPRESFRQFLQTVKGLSAPWTSADVELVREFGYLLRDQLLKIQKVQLDETQALFQLLYRQSADALFLTDYHTEKIVDCNQRAMEFFEVDRKEDLIGLSGIGLHFIDKKADIQQLELFRKKLREEGEVSEDISYKSLKGRPFWGRFSAKALQGSLQKMFVVRVADISSSKQYEAELKKHNQELRKVNEELDRFVYSASHDLRAPISSLQGLLEVAKGADGVAEMQSYLDMGKKSLDRLDHFIQEILDYSRNSRVEVRRDEVLLNMIIHGVLDNFAYVEKYQSIEKRVDIKQEAPFYSDPFRLKVIFNNLISNALRYSRPEHGESYINVVARVTREEAIITVEDNGQGITTKHLPRIFEMFYRADNRKSGSGLGLYIVKETLDKLGGSIEVAAEIDKGTNFRIRLPNHTPHKPENKID